MLEPGRARSTDIIHTCTAEAGPEERTEHGSVFSLCSEESGGADVKNMEVR